MRIVVALGGNALGYELKEQKENSLIAAKSIAYLVKKGHEVVITHGNGPQVGLINLSFTLSKSVDSTLPVMDFPECGAMSQGYIGYHLQNAIQNVLKSENISKNVATLVTQVLVDKNDEAFINPVKPIGKYYREKEAKLLEKENGYIMKNMGEKGYRRVIASPKPIDIIEKDAIISLIENNTICISSGGGGIPVYFNDGILTGVDAVIDKDHASSLLATIIGADMLIILTNVDKVSLNYKKDNEILLDEMTVNEAELNIKKGSFGEGSMRPKVEACASFTKKTKKTSLITSLNKLEEAFEKKNGTYIVI